MNRFNGEAWDELDPWMEVAPIVGVDFYHYKRDFWLHAYANYILPYHNTLQEIKNFYLKEIIGVKVDNKTSMI